MRKEALTRKQGAWVLGRGRRDLTAPLSRVPSLLPFPLANGSSPTSHGSSACCRGHSTQFRDNPQQDTTVAGHWWLTPIILASREAEIRRIEI
jgi:hypothetical protein